MNQEKTADQAKLLSREEIPKVIRLDLTRQAYESDKTQLLSRQTPLVRGHMREVFAFYRTLDPDLVIDAIEEGTTIKDKYEESVFQERIQVAAARGYFRVAPEKIKRRVKAFITAQNALTQLRFENPLVYQVIMTFGEKGKAWLETNTADLLTLLKLD